MSWRRFALSGPGAFGSGFILIWLRHRIFGFESLGSVALFAALGLQFFGYRQMLAERQPEGLIQGLELSQAGWFFLALALPGQHPALGAVGFLFSQLLLKAPLAQLLAASGFRNRLLIFFGFLAMVGCLPFSSFSAYLETFVPLIAIGDAMTQKLSSGLGFLAAIVLLSVVYQSCALGYFYWSRILRADGGETGMGPEAWLSCLGLACSLAFVLVRGWYGPMLRSLLALAGISFNP